ncbi:MAG: histone deacetylase [Crenarchaeota archaeon]|nr:histone deacetylase [Thermoproteota archaeon]
MKTNIVFSEKCLHYGTWHIEGPQRLRVAKEILKEKGYNFVEPEPATEDDLLLIHDFDYLWNLKKGLIEDHDTPAYDKIFDYASVSAGAAIMAAKTNSFSLTRPPGHHVGANGPALGVYTRGFCYTNNIAIAVKTLDKSTLILDIDGHHGNGTQEIFLGDSKVTYISIHRSPLYPGTGIVSEQNCINYPLPGDCGEQNYLQTLDKALTSIDVSKFEVLAISAGFDTYQNDLASLNLTENSFYEIGKRIGSFKKRTFFVMEGGYLGEKNGLSIDQLLKGYEAEAYK